MSIDFKEIYRKSKIRGYLLFLVFFISKIKDMAKESKMKHTMDFGNLFIVQR